MKHNSYMPGIGPVFRHPTFGRRFIAFLLGLCLLISRGAAARESDITAIDILSSDMSAPPAARRVAADSLELAPYSETGLPSDEQPAYHFFYHGYGYGSDLMIHPLRLILNGGFGILQVENRDNELDGIDYSTGFDNVYDNLRYPFKAIKEEGMAEFFVTQILPFSVNSKKAYYWPNYTLHLIGGGMSYRMMQEWFDAHRFPYPRIHALLTITAYHLLNEVVENSSFVGYNTDPIADMYIFNPAGILLFSSDRVSRFFSNTLNMADWSFQVCYDPWRNTIENNGQNFVMKYWFGERERYGLFYHFGTHGEIGLSFKRDNGQCFSFGAGLIANKLVDLSDDSNLRSLTAEMVPSAGIFYDRNNSLLASLIYSRKQDYMLRLNLYPGLFSFKGLTPGFFLAINQDDRVGAGITLSYIPFGLARAF